jgi:hypothetical protein
MEAIHLEHAQQQNCSNDPVVGDVMLVLDAAPERADCATVVLVGLQAELFAAEMVIGSHLSDAQGCKFQQAMAVMAIEAGKEAQMTREAVCLMRRHEAANEVAERDVII